jgi:hypothetical protein
MEITTLSLGHPVRRILHHAIYFFGGSLETEFMCHQAHAHPRNSWSDNACTAGHYSGHTAPRLGWVWLPCLCVLRDPRCTHWRIIINAWGSWTVSAADSVCCARAGWEIYFLITFETAPFFCSCPVCVCVCVCETHTHTYIQVKRWSWPCA